MVLFLALDFVATLLGVPSVSLQNALQVRTMTTQHGGRVGTSYKGKKNNKYVPFCFLFFVYV
jgi:hypothetical protein